MPALAVAVVGSALLDSLNPSLIVADVYLTLRPHPFPRTHGFTIAASVVTLAGGLEDRAQPAAVHPGEHLPPPG